MKRRTMISRPFKAALCVAVATLGTGLAQASTNYFKFNEDPYSLFSLIFRIGEIDPTHGDLGQLAAQYVSTNGSTLEEGVGDQSTNGYFALTQTTPGYTKHGMRSGVVFNDLDNGLIVMGFTFSCDLRVGAGSDTPADGFSLNYARIGDPCIASGDTWGTVPGGGGGDQEGTTTGLALCFDAYTNSAADVVGLTIKVDGVVITNIPMTTKNGACDDITSLQTGTNNAGLAGLCWQPLYVNLSTNGLLTVKYKEADLVNDFPLQFSPSPGRLILGGRTGGLWQEQDVDNITIITVPSAEPVVGAVASTPYGWKLNIYDSGYATPDTSSITVTVDGVAVTPTSITQSGNIGFGDGTGVTMVAYDSPTPIFVSGSTHTNVVHFTGTGFSGAVDKTLVFTVPPVLGSMDRVHRYLGRFQYKSNYSPNQGGHTGALGDYAADIGSPGRTSNGILVTDADMMDAMNAAAVNDTLSFAFWLRHRNFAWASALWAYSGTAPENRGVNLHCPYYDNENATFFFDTGGTGTGTRISALMTTFPAYSGSNSWWYTWHHIVAIKNGPDKEVWIDGQLFMTGTGQGWLYPDISQLYIGSGVGKLSVDGWIDDFAVYSSPLSGLDVTNLFNGTAPDAISASPNLIAWWDFNDAPDLTAQPMGDKLVVTFTQVLQSSTNVSGPFVDVPNATSPYTNDLFASPQMFFRTRK